MRNESAGHQLAAPISRRGLLRSTLGGAVGAAVAGRSGSAADAVKPPKKLLLLFLSGGASQLETFDPKPDSKYGGPFRPIPTAIPGIQVGELLPHTATILDRLAVIRSVNTGETSHFRGHYLLQSGRKVPGYPVLGSVMAQLLERPGDELPGYVTMRRQNPQAYTDVGDAGFLGPRYEGVMIIDGKPPANIRRPESIDVAAVTTRDRIRRLTNQRFLERRSPRSIQSYTESFQKADALMRRREVFDLDQESAADRARYGDHHFGRNCLLARRLLESGVHCVKVAHHDWDAHFENFHWQRQRCLEFDRTFVTLMDDFRDRGLLDETLVVIMGEMGRTPRINYYGGRDHWARSMSIFLSGGGLKMGQVVGATNSRGEDPVRRVMNSNCLLSTVYQRFGVNTDHHFFDNTGRPVPILTDGEPIRELL